MSKKIDKVFFAGDSFDRSIQYDVPAMECDKSKVKFNASPQNIYINNQSLDSYIKNVASTVSSSADCRLDGKLSTLESRTDVLESKMDYGVADTINEIVSHLGTNSSTIASATSTISELEQALKNMADKFESLTKVEKKKLAGYTPEWYKCKRELKTRRKNEFKIEELLTI